MRKIIICTLLVLSIVFSNIVYAADSESAGDTRTLNQVFNNYEISAVMPVTQFYKEDEVYIDFVFSENVSVYGIEALIEYNSDNLEFKKATNSFSNDNRCVEITQSDIDNEIMYVFSRIGNFEEKPIENSIFRLVFSAKEIGKSVVSLKSFKVVYSDLSYEIFDDLNCDAYVTVEKINTSDKDETPKKRGSGGNSRGGGGGGIKFSAAEEDKLKIEEKNQNITEQIPIKEENINFTDISDVPWAETAILYLSSAGVLNGYEDSTFTPNDYITRAELTELVSKAFLDDVTAEKVLTFTDVSETDWFFDSVNACLSVGIINGESPETFAPARNILREEFATILARCISVKGYDLTNKRSNDGFLDENDISEYAVNHIDLLYCLEILNGESGYFYPKNNLTRAEAAVGLYRLISLIENDGQEV